jgi:hypothetical protein
VSLPSALPLPLSAGGDPAPSRPRWAFWRSPEGQPPWARPVLLGIAAAAALLYARNITAAGLAPFYSVAVKSMSVSWNVPFMSFPGGHRRGAECPLGLAGQMWRARCTGQACGVRDPAEPGAGSGVLATRMPGPGRTGPSRTST